MNLCTHPKAVIAAACLAFTAGLAGAQSSPPSNTTTSPDPLQVNPTDGVPNAGNGKLTPGTGTGSSRTMRNETMRNDRTPVDPASINRSAGSPDPQMTHPAIETKETQTPDSTSTRGAVRNGSRSNTNSPTGSDALNGMEPTGAGPGTRAARRDRG
jgi:hypothetical protein